MDSMPEVQQLGSIQKDLLSNFYQFTDLTKNKVLKSTISNLIEQYRQVLDSVKTEIQFRYDIDLDSFRLQNSAEDDLVSLIIIYHKSNEFLTNFKKGLIKKQYDLKNNYKQSFQEAKIAKYTFHDKEVPETASQAADRIKNSENLSQDSKIMATTTKITSKLIQSSQILQSSLVQSQLNLEELTIQNDALTGLGDKYTFLKGILEKSDGFINDIKLSTEKDKRKMYYALGFFALCVAYVLYNRLFRLFIRILFYMVRMVLGVFGLFKSRQPAIIERIEISPTLVDDGQGEIIYDTVVSEVRDAEDTRVAIESAIYEEIEGDEVDEDTAYERIMDEL